MADGWKGSAVGRSPAPASAAAGGGGLVVSKDEVINILLLGLGSGGRSLNRGQFRVLHVYSSLVIRHYLLFYADEAEKNAGNFCIHKVVTKALKFVQHSGTALR